MNNHFQPVYWHSGLYLQPQHFQLTDIQQQYWNHRYHQISHPFYWGMIRFELDLQALRNQELSINHAVLLFPDGALVDCDVNGVLPSRSLHQFTESYTQPIPFYIGLRRFQPGNSNVIERDTLPVNIQEVCRWTLHNNSCLQPDLFGKGPDADIQTLRYQLSFFLENEIEELTGYSLLPAGVLNNQDGNIILDEQMIVPSLSMNATVAGKKWLNGFCQTLLSKIRRLEILKTEGKALTKCTPDEFRTLMLILQTLCRYAAVLEQYRLTESIHPWQIYIVLQQLNAELLSFNTTNSSVDSEALINALRTPWDHQKPDQALHSVVSRFDYVIDQLLSLSGSRAVLRPAGEGRYLSSIEHVAVSAEAEVYLCLNSAQFSAYEVRPVDEENSKLCAPGQLENLINYSLPGVPLIVLQRLPHNLSVRDDAFCYRLDTRSPLWSTAWQEKQVIFYWMDAPADLQVELLWQEVK